MAWRDRQIDTLYRQQMLEEQGAHWQLAGACMVTNVNIQHYSYLVPKMSISTYLQYHYQWKIQVRTSDTTI